MGDYRKMRRIAYQAAAIAAAGLVARHVQGAGVVGDHQVVAPAGQLVGQLRPARGQVGVVLAGETAPGRLDRSLAGAALHAEHIVRFAFCKRAEVLADAVERLKAL